MALLAFNTTGSEILLVGTSVRLPASPTPPLRGLPFNITSELQNCTSGQFAALETQRLAGGIDYIWTDYPEFDATPLTITTPGLISTPTIPITIDDGIVSNGYKEIIPIGSAFPSTYTWWTSAAKIDKIMDLTVTRDSVQRPVLEVFRFYGPSNTLTQTVTDTIVYSGAFEATRTRTVT